VPDREYLRVGIDDAPARIAEGWTLVAGWFPFATSWWAWFARDPESGAGEGRE
jgi:hypothetical protein